MAQRKAWSVIGGGLLLLVMGWLLFACVAPPGAEPVMPAGAGREVGGEPTCKTFTSTDVPKIILDSGLETGEGVYTTSQLLAQTPGYITDLTVTFTISHTYPAALTVVLCGPRNLYCQLLDGALTEEQGEYTLAFSSAPTHADFADIYDGPPYTGSYPADDIEEGGEAPPEAPAPAFVRVGAYDEEAEPLVGLAKFRNAAAAGIWQLAFLDDEIDDIGVLSAWSLELCTVPLKNTPTPTATVATAVPLPAWTPLYGCNQLQFVAEDKGQDNPCDCSDPLFRIVPDSDADAGSSTQYFSRFVMCAPQCDWATYSMGHVVGEIQLAAYAASSHSWFDQAHFAAADVGVPSEALPHIRNSGCIGGDCVGLGCRTDMDQESTGGTVDTYGDGVSFYVGAEALDADSCPGTNAYSWSYEVTWGACADTHVRPTSTPLPTVTPTVTPWYTRPCPTSAAPNVGWWMW